MDLDVFPARKAGFKMLFLLCKQSITTLKNQLMSNVLTKQVQNKISRYFLQKWRHLTKPESRCVREMTTGILKSATVFVNKIATNICDTISLSQTTKRFRNHYNKTGFFKKYYLKLALIQLKRAFPSPKQASHRPQQLLHQVGPAFPGLISFPRISPPVFSLRRLPPAKKRHNFANIR